VELYLVMDLLFPLISIFGTVWTLGILFISGLILYFVWNFIRESVPALKGIGPENISPLSIVLSILLILTINLLFAKVWVDLTRFAGASNTLQVIIYHTVFVAVVSFLAIFMMLLHKGTKSGLVILPYFIVSLLFLVRVLYEICAFLVIEYKNVGVYVVIILLILVLTGLIFVIQKSYESYKKRENRIGDAMSKESSIQKDSLPPV